MSVEALILKHLGFLLAQDTCNPPRSISPFDPLYVELQAHFRAHGFEVELSDYGAGHLSFYALRGHPEVLFNVHLDTVPVVGAWQHEPLAMTRVGDRVYGRGACDIKGAAACLMALAETSDADMAVLFTSDEEGADNCCVEQFICDHDLSNFSQVVVAEPTGASAVLQHRGYVSAHGRFSGLSGHSSQPDTLAGNAIHRAMHWLQAALAEAAAECSEDNPSGPGFNAGSVRGGAKNNMIAEHCELGFSVRVPPGEDPLGMYHRFIGLPGGSQAEWHHSLLAPPLPLEAALKDASAAFCMRVNWPVAADVNFWTEAALFSAAGLPALVLGPGHIAQAHTVDEWVEVAQLILCHQRYAQVLA